MKGKIAAKIGLAALLLNGIVFTNQGFAFTSTWNGLGSNNDLNNPNNWIPSHVPDYSEIAEFDSSVSHINKFPNASNLDFIVDSINFTHSASAFTFTFENCLLSLNQSGITGTNTDTKIFINNVDNNNYVDSNLEMSGSCPIGNAMINMTNSGTVSGSTTGVYVSRIDSRQVDVSGNFSMLSGGKLIVANIGKDESSGGGNNVIAEISYEQGRFSDAVTLGNNCEFSFSNSGTNTSTNNTSSTYVAETEEGGVYVGDIFTAGSGLSLSISNAGTDESIGVGGNLTGYISGTAQLELNDLVEIGDNAVITITNSGVNGGTATDSRNRSGYVSDEQLYIQGPFIGGNNFNIHLSNSGVDSSSGVGNNYAGYINSAQLELRGSVNLVGKNYANFVVENSGLYTGSSTSLGNVVGYVSDNQIHFSDAFRAGDFLNIAVSNYGEDHGVGSKNSAVGYVNGGQLKFSRACIIGDNASITLSNNGISTSLATNQVGIISGEQLSADFSFVAGKNLSISATNNATISGDSTEVGYVSGCQINFIQGFTAGDGTMISAFNLGKGSVFGSQILFQQGFDILTGKATFQAVNEGNISSYGIEVQNGSGGNAHIILGNSSLYVSSPSTDFTISSLNGDSTSFVQSSPALIIDTDQSVFATFAGDIKDYSSASTLTKTGKGTQKLSGINSLTGLTTVHEGTLVLTGSLGGNVNIDVDGILKGTGSVLGNVVNLGTIAPGESIGTINFLSDFANNGGNYEVEVSGTGASDLIHVNGDANLNEGYVIVSTVDGTYKFQDRYTIVETGGARNGFYTGVTAISSLVQPIISYDAQHVYLLLLTNIQNAAQTPNQLAIAEQLDGIVNPNAQQNILLSEIVNLSSSDARQALDSLSGYQHAADLITTQMVNRQFIRRLYDPIRSIVTTEPDCCCEPFYNQCCQGLTGWVDVGGTFMNINGHNQDHGLNTLGYNITAGIQKSFSSACTIGVAGAYEQDHLHFKHSGGSERCDTWLVGLYGLYRPSCYYGFADFVYGNSSNHMKRSINVGTLKYKAKSNPDTQQYTFYGEVGMDFDFCNGLIQPFFGVEAGTFRRKHVRESYANGWGLEVDKRNRTLTTTRLGVHLTYNDAVAYGSSLSFDLAWNCLVSDLKNHVHEQFNEFGTPFTIEWTQLNRNSVDYALTFSQPLGCNLRGYIEGAGESWKNANVFDVLAGLEYSW